MSSTRTSRTSSGTRGRDLDAKNVLEVLDVQDDVFVYADKVLEGGNDRDLSVCRVLEVDVLVDEDREEVELKNKNLNGRPM